MATDRNLVNVLGLLVTLTLVSYAISVCGQGLPKSGLFPFGDSYYDTGNKQYLSKEFLPCTTWPYGKSTDEPNGRFSDGRIVPDFLATFMEIPNPIPPALKPDANFSRGACFAVADASVLGDAFETMTFAEQVARFKLMRSNWNKTFLSESTFLIEIATEDYLNFSKTSSDADGSRQQAFVIAVIARIKELLAELYQLGARKFGYQNLPPIGCLPIVRQEHNLTGDDCYEKLNDLAKQHNEKIRPMLEDLAKKLSGFQYTILDFYGILSRRLVSAPATKIFNDYRFSNTIDACCGIGSHNAFGCGYINVHSKLCDYQRAYLFYDGRHNSEKANEEVAHLFFSGDPAIVSPMTVRELMVYPVNMPMLEY